MTAGPPAVQDGLVYDSCQMRRLVAHQHLLADAAHFDPLLDYLSVDGLIS
jgi:hypothetical protein